MQVHTRAYMCNMPNVLMRYCIINTRTVYARVAYKISNLSPKIRTNSCVHVLFGGRCACTQIKRTR
jgi:hypothetical protein